MGLFISTIGTSVVISELGITFTHPIINFQVDAQFSAEEIKKADSLTAAILAGTLTWRRTSVGSVELATSYDPDFIEAESDSTGTGLYWDRTLRLNELWTPEFQATSNSTKYLTVASAFHQVFTGTIRGQILTLPDATTLKVGHLFVVHNNSTAIVTINNFSNTLITAPMLFHTVRLKLLDNTTTAGVWCFQIASNKDDSTIFITASSNTYQITSENDVIIFSGSTLGQLVNIGDARDYNIGKVFEIKNICGYGFNVLYSSGLVLERTKPLESLIFTLQDNSTSDGVWYVDESANKENDPDYSVSIYDDWVAGTVAGDLNWSTIASGTSAAAIINTANISTNNPGVAQLDTGSTTTGRCSLTLGISVMTFGDGWVGTDKQVMLPVLSSSTQEYIVRVGFGDNTGAGDMVDGIYFEYNRLISNNWLLKSSSSSTRTQVITSIPVVANVWFDLTSEVNDLGTLIEFFINNVFIGSIATNIPTTVARVFGPLLKIEKSAGTTTRQLLVDYFATQKVFTIPR